MSHSSIWTRRKRWIDELPKKRTNTRCRKSRYHELLDVLLACLGKIILLKYPNQIYDERLKAWNYEDRVRDNKASGSIDKSIDPKTERIWIYI